MGFNNNREPLSVIFVCEHVVLVRVICLVVVYGIVVNTLTPPSWTTIYITLTQYIWPYRDKYLHGR